MDAKETTQLQLEQVVAKKLRIEEQILLMQKKVEMLEIRQKQLESKVEKV